MNQKRIYKYGILTLCLFNTLAQARLEESIEQSVLRYGQPFTEMADGGLVFLKDGIVVTAHFTDNACDAINYLRKDESPFSLEEAGKIVQDVESKDGRRHWEVHGTHDKIPKFDKSPKGRPTYWTSDDGFLAHFNDNGLVLRKDPDFKPNKRPLDGL